MSCFPILGCSTVVFVANKCILWIYFSTQSSVYCVLSRKIPRMNGFQNNFTVSYERHKMIAVTDLQIAAYENQVTPKLVLVSPIILSLWCQTWVASVPKNFMEDSCTESKSVFQVSRMIIAVRDELKEYKNVFSPVYSRLVAICLLCPLWLHLH